MRCPDCYRSTEDVFIHRLSGTCRALATSQPPSGQAPRERKVREHSGPWPSAKHGTRSRYQRGCRCGDCVKANYDYLSLWRERRKAQA